MSLLPAQSYLNTEPGGYGRSQRIYTILKWSFDYA